MVLRVHHPCPALFFALLLASVPASAQDHQQNVAATENWLSAQILPSGAIQHASTLINPYFANLAAIGMIKGDTTKIPQVESWIQWYLSHLNWPDSNGVYGTVCDYNVADGDVETSTGYYDSADSYAATFLSLTWALWETGDPGAQLFIKDIGEYKFNVVGNVITNLQQNDGLVFAKPDYQIKFLMDNSENYRGLMDLADLMQAAWNDTSSSNWYIVRATDIQNGIQNVLYNPATKLYYTSAGAPAPNLTRWYPDSIAQLFPITNGVIAGGSGQARTIYNKFNKAWLKWTDLSFNSQDPFPWTVASYAAALMGDNNRANAYIASIQKKYQHDNFPWPFYPAEGGWYIRTNANLRP
jgi:hypothetical protein